jgi:hypothetical protein
LKVESQRDPSMPVFTAVLFTIAKTQQQPKCWWNGSRGREPAQQTQGLEFKQPKTKKDA